MNEVMFRKVCRQVEEEIAKAEDRSDIAKLYMTVAGLIITRKAKGFDYQESGMARVFVIFSHRMADICEYTPEQKQKIDARLGLLNSPGSPSA